MRSRRRDELPLDFIGDEAIHSFRVAERISVGKRELPVYGDEGRPVVGVHSIRKPATCCKSRKGIDESARRVVRDEFQMNGVGG